MIKLAILVPTRGRPHNIERLHKALEKTCQTDYTLFARLDDDDLVEYPNIDEINYVVGPRIYFAASVNELAEIATQKGYTHFAILGDDVLPETVGWDKALIEALPELGVAYASDGLEELHGPDLPTHVVVPVELYKRLGWLGLPSLRHLFCDNVWRELGKLTNFIYLPDVKLTHLHRWNKSAPDDKTYQEANNKQLRELDRRAFETWRDGEGLQIAKQQLS